MKITYVENIRMPTEKAHGYQIMKTVEAMVGAGCEVELVVPDRRNSLTEKEIFEYYKTPSTFKITKLPVWDAMPFAGPLIRVAYAVEYWSFLRSVRRWQKTATVSDAIYTRDLAVAEMLIKSAVQTPIFVELHDARTDDKRWPSLASGVKGWIVISQALKTLLERQGIPSTAILVASDAYDDVMFSHMPVRSEARADLEIADDEFILLYAGKLFPWKGVDGIAPAFATLPSPCRVVCLGGHADDITRVKKLIGQPSDVQFIEHLPQLAVLKWLGAADAALLPTSAAFDIGKLYTSPLKMFEYLAAGLPTIASDVPSSREILDERVAVFFQPDDPQDFLRAVNDLLARTADERTLMSQNARERAKPFTWKARGEKIAQYIQEQVSKV